MQIDFYERFFIWLTIATLIVFFVALIASAYGSAVVLTNPAGQVDPRILQETEFAEPGIRELAPGQYEVVMVGQAWAFVPSEIRIPAGSEVTFRVTTRDVIHGFELTGVPLNMMLIPGQISVATTRFDEPGEHIIICHEYCGVGHQGMYGTIIVEETLAQASAR